MKLSARQEEFIFEYLRKSGIEHQALRDDLADHLCCVIESKLKRSTDFNAVFEEALADLAPHGLTALQHQTLYLLNSKRLIIMKKLMYSFGLFGAIALSAGTVFKILHWSGANILFISGMVVLLLIFVPLLTFDLYKTAIAKAWSERAKLIFGVIASVLVGLSAIFKILHLQGANIMLLLGALIFIAGFLPFLFFTLYKKSVS